MNFISKGSYVVVLVSICSIATANVVRTGWLDRVVRYHRERFEDDLKQLLPLQIEAWVERAPAGYRDAGGWDAAAVSRLLALLAVSNRAAPARRALARALQPNTRRFLTKYQSWGLFPSLGKNHVNDIYYDLSSSDTSSEAEYGNGVKGIHDAWAGVGGVPPDHAVVVLKNPVEARLPSARISVKLLREIMEARAIAARQMPSTTRSTIAWKPMNNSSTSAPDAEIAPAVPDGSDDTATTSESGPGTGEGGETTTEVGAETVTTGEVVSTGASITTDTSTTEEPTPEN